MRGTDFAQRLAKRLLFQKVNPEGTLMLETTRKVVAVLPRLSIEVLAAVGTLSTLGWLLANDLVRPISVYLLEIFLTF